MINSKISQIKIQENQKSAIRDLIFRNKDVFSWNDFDSSVTHLTKHYINTNNHPTIKQKPYKCPVSTRNEIEKQVNTMLKNNIIRESDSPWACPVVMVKKKNADYRF